MISLRHFPPYVRNKLSVQEAVLLGMRAVQDQNHHARINLFLKTLGELPPGRGVGCQSHSNNSNKRVIGEQRVDTMNSCMHPMSKIAFAPRGCLHLHSGL
jgi:hypothetical protein